MSGITNRKKFNGVNEFTPQMIEAVKAYFDVEINGRTISFNSNDYFVVYADAWSYEDDLDACVKVTLLLGFGEYALAEFDFWFKKENEVLKETFAYDNETPYFVWNLYTGTNITKVLSAHKLGITTPGWYEDSFQFEHKERAIELIDSLDQDMISIYVFSGHDLKREGRTDFGREASFEYLEEFIPECIEGIKEACNNFFLNGEENE